MSKQNIVFQIGKPIQKTNEKIQNNKKWFRNFVSYLTRSEAVVKTTLNSEELKEINGSANKNKRKNEYNASSQNAFSGIVLNGEFLNENELEEYVSKFDKEYDDRNNFFWSTVVSFDKDFFESNSIYTPEDLNKSLINQTKKMLSSNGIDNSNVDIAFAVHKNTDNIHAHLFFYEKEAKEYQYDKKKHKKKKKFHDTATMSKHSIKKFKEELTDNLNINISSVKEDIHSVQNELKKNSFNIKDFKSLVSFLNSSPKELVEEYMFLKKEFQSIDNYKKKFYGSSDLDDKFRNSIDGLTKKIIVNNPVLKGLYNNLEDSAEEYAELKFESHKIFWSDYDVENEEFSKLNLSFNSPELDITEDEKIILSKMEGEPDYNEDTILFLKYKKYSYKNEYFKSKSDKGQFQGVIPNFGNEIISSFKLNPRKSNNNKPFNSAIKQNKYESSLLKGIERSFGDLLYQMNKEAMSNYNKLQREINYEANQMKNEHDHSYK